MAMLLFGPYVFPYVHRTEVNRGQKIEERSLEKGVVFHDHVQELSPTIDVLVHFPGKLLARNVQYSLLVQVMRLSRVRPLPLVLQEPFEIWPQAVLESVECHTEDDLRYGVGPWSWLVARCIFRKVHIVGATAVAEVIDPATGSIAPGPPAPGGALPLSELRHGPVKLAP